MTEIRRPVLFSQASAARAVDLDPRTFAKRAVLHCIKPAGFLKAGGSRGLQPLYDQAAIDDLRYQIDGDPDADLRGMTPEHVAQEQAKHAAAAQ